MVLFVLTCVLVAPLGIITSTSTMVDGKTAFQRNQGVVTAPKSMGKVDAANYDVVTTDDVRSSTLTGNGVDSKTFVHLTQNDTTNVSKKGPILDLDAIIGYLRSSYIDGKGYQDTPVEGQLTSLSTYQALFASRIFGLEFYQFSTFRNTLEGQIASHLAESFRQSDQNKDFYGGFYLLNGAIYPTLEGTFGVIATIDLLQQSILYETQFINRSNSTPRFVLSRNVTFSLNLTNPLSPNITQALAFRDTWPETRPTIKATFESVFVLQALNRSEFNATDALSVLNYLKSQYDADTGLFNDGSYFTSPIVQTWYALRLIDVLLPLVNEANLTQSPLTLSDILDINAAIEGIRQAQDLTSDPDPFNATSTYGGFSFAGHAPDVEQTGAALAVLSELGVPVENETESVINRTAALLFFNRSQYLDRASKAPFNRLYGGFASSPRFANRTIAGDDFHPRMINMKNLFWVALGMYVSGWIVENIDVVVETNTYLNDKSYGMSNYLVQGETATVNLKFKYKDSKYSHGDLVLTNVTIPTWDLDVEAEANPNAFPRNATYQFTVLNDTNRAYNWSLGSHPLLVKLGIRSLNLVSPLDWNFTTSVYVGYRVTLIKFNSTTTTPPIPTTIAPNNTLLVEVRVENRSLYTYQAHNVTTGNISFLLTDPSGKVVLNQTHSLNGTLFRPLLNYTFANDSLLGTWKLEVVYHYNQSAMPLNSFNESRIVKSYEVNVETDLEILDFTLENELYPGSYINATLSMAYSNGYISPKINASLAFSFKDSKEIVFSVKLVHVNGTNFTVASDGLVPLELLMGSYDLIVQFTWNSTRNTLPETLTNETLMTADILGKVVALNASLINDKGTYSVLDEVTAEFRIGVFLPNGSVIEIAPLLNDSIQNDNTTLQQKSNENAATVTKASDILLSFLTNSTNLDDVFDILQVASINATQNWFNASVKLNPNLRNGEYAVTFKVKLPTNGSFVSIRDLRDNGTSVLNLTLHYEADFMATDFVLQTGKGSTISGDEVFRSKGTIVLAFAVRSNAEGAIIPGLSLYAVLRDADGNEISVLAVAFSNESNEYHVTLALLGLDLGLYSIDIYTVTAISPDTKLNSESISFNLTEPKELDIGPIFQSVALFTLLLAFVIVVYLNYRVEKRQQA